MRKQLCCTAWNRASGEDFVGLPGSRAATGQILAPSAGQTLEHAAGGKPDQVERKTEIELRAGPSSDLLGSLVGIRVRRELFQAPKSVRDADGAGTRIKSVKERFKPLSSQIGVSSTVFPEPRFQLALDWLRFRLFLLGNLTARSRKPKGGRDN